MQSSHKIAEILYSQQGGDQGTSQGHDEQKNDTNDQGPIDTEIS